MRGLYIHADTLGVSRSATLEYTGDDGTVSTLAITGIDHDVLTRRYYPITGNRYAISHRVRPTDAASWEFVGYELDAEPAPPLTTKASEWTNPGGNGIGARFVHGCIVDADTSAVNVSLNVLGDEEVLLAVIDGSGNSGPLNTLGRAQIPFSFDLPFITHLVQAIPSAACRIWGIQWLSNPEPELAHMWRSQQTSCGIPGWKFFGDGYLGVRSDNNIRFYIIADGVQYEVTFYDAVTNTSLARRRLRFRPPMLKAKSVEFMATTETTAGQIAIYEADFSLEVKAFGSEGGWQIVSPLGAEHHRTGAPI